jgi:hypothetical protein
VAGQRPSVSATVTSVARLDLGLLRDLYSFVDFDSEIPDGTLRGA